MITQLWHYAKICRTLANQAVTVGNGSTSGGVPNLTLNPSISGPSSLMLISINTGTFPGTPAVRLIGDCHFLHRLCQLLFFCFFFKRSQHVRYMSGLRRTAETSLVRPDDMEIQAKGIVLKRYNFARTFPKVLTLVICLT